MKVSTAKDPQSELDVSYWRENANYVAATAALADWEKRCAELDAKRRVLWQDAQERFGGAGQPPAWAPVWPVHAQFEEANRARSQAREQHIQAERHAKASLQPHALALGRAALDIILREMAQLAEHIATFEHQQADVEQRTGTRWPDLGRATLSSDGITEWADLVRAEFFGSGSLIRTSEDI